MLYLSIKALHIIFVTSWFAVLFYLRRLYDNHAMVTDAATLERLTLMASLERASLKRTQVRRPWAFDRPACSCID